MQSNRKPECHSEQVECLHFTFCYQVIKTATPTSICSPVCTSGGIQNWSDRCCWGIIMNNPPGDEVLHFLVDELGKFFFWKLLNKPCIPSLEQLFKSSNYLWPIEFNVLARNSVSSVKGCFALPSWFELRKQLQRKWFRGAFLHNIQFIASDKLNLFNTGLFKGSLQLDPPFNCIFWSSLYILK